MSVESDARFEESVPVEPLESAAETSPDSSELAPFIVIRRTTFNYIAIAGVFLILGVVIGAFSAFKVERANRSWLSDALGEAIEDNAGLFTGMSVAEAGPSLNDSDSRFEVETGSEYFMGGASAPVEIVEFGDYNCSYCRRFHGETLGQITETFGDNVRYVFRDFPILGDSSVLASMAARCAGEQDADAFWPYHDILFNNPGTFVGDATAFTRFAAQLELDVDAFDTCMEDRRHLEAIQGDYNIAREYGITGTPAFFVNGRPIIGAQPFEEFASVIVQELEAEGVDIEQYDLDNLLPGLTLES